jgi:sugar phosphate permease
MPSPLGFAQVTSAQRRTLLAAALGWMLDAFDAMLYALVLTYIMRDLGMSKAVAGSLGSLTLLASGIGGVAFGFLADRVGRNLLIRFRSVDFDSDAGCFPFHPRPGNGR